jgi:hypothetical protein
VAANRGENPIALLRPILASATKLSYVPEEKAGVANDTPEKSKSKDGKSYRAYRQSKPKLNDAFEQGVQVRSAPLVRAGPSSR